MQYPLRRLAAIYLLTVFTLCAASWPDKITQGNSYYDHGFYREAILEYEGALPLADSPQNRAATLYRLALAHGKLAEYTAAEDYYKGAVAIFRAGGESPKLAVSLAGLGEMYRAEYRLDDALETEAHSLRILKLSGRLETQEAATVFSIIGEVLYDQHRFKAAQQSFRRALNILEKTVGEDDPDYATSLNNLGVVTAERKHLEEAEALLLQALEIREARLGFEHPLVASTLLSLSSVYMEQKRSAEAERACHRALEMMQRFYVASHPELIKAHIGLALIARRSGNPAAAAGILEKAMATIDAQRSAMPAVYVRLLSLYAQYLGDAGEKEKSREFRMEARQLLEQAAWKSPARSTVTLGELEAGRPASR